MREDEERCKNAFDAFLKQHYQCEDISWVCGDRNKPPDYFLKIRSTEYAVEVTSILEKTMLGNKSIDHIEVDKSVNSFINAIQKDAIAKGILKGAYIIRYKPIKDFGKQKWSIARKIIGYLKQTKDLPYAQAEYIVGKGHFGWYIYKIQSDKNYLSGGTGDAKWEGEAANELCDSLNEVIDRKSGKLKGISLPKILLIHDRYVWIDAPKWQKYIAKINNISNFHTIFLISGKSSDVILHSIETSWLNNKSAPS